MSKGNNASAYVIGLRLTMLQTHLYQYWTVAETQLIRRSAPRPCCRPRVIEYYIKKNYLLFMDNVSTLKNPVGWLISKSKIVKYLEK